MSRLWPLVLLVFLSACTLPEYWPLGSENTGSSAKIVQASSLDETPLPSVQDSPGKKEIPASAEAESQPRHEKQQEDSLSKELAGVPGKDDEVAPVSEETAEDIELLQANPVFSENEGPTVDRQEVVFDFPVVENDRVRYFVDLYSGRARRTFGRWLERSGRYLPMMREIFAEYELPQDLAYLAMIESGFNDRAYSWAHAVGPWQFIESTGRGYGLEGDWWFDERRDPEKATHAAARFLRDLHRTFDGDWYLAVAGYNAGGGKIQRAIKMYKTRDFWELSRGKYLQEETKHYVPKLLAALTIAKQPEKYGFTDLEFHPPLKYDVVDIPSATDLELVAELCDIDYEEIKKLNPELKRWSTPPGRTQYELRIPAGSKGKFLAAYAEIPIADRAKYKRHKIASGDTLLKLAKTYGIRVQDIVTLNDIGNPRALQIGTDLILPLKKGYSSRPIDELKDDYIRTRRKTYTVRKGDSLWKISRRFDVTEKQLRVWNRLGWSNMLRPGQTLIVSSSAAGSSRQVAKKNRTKMVYEVKAGDTLWDIGRRYDVRTREIMSWNNLGQGHILQPGDKLTLLVDERHSG